MTRTLGQRGFSPTVIMLAIVVIAAIGLGTWYISGKDSSDKSSKTSSSEDRAKQPPKSESVVATDPSEGGKYLVVKEWGVRFLLPEDLRDDILTLVSEAQSSGTVVFASKKLNTLTGDKTCDVVRSADGSHTQGIQSSLSRLNPETYDKDYLDYYRSQLTFIKKVGSYEYYARKQGKNPPITCLTGQHEEFNAIEQSITDQLNAAFQGLEGY